MKDHQSGGQRNQTSMNLERVGQDHRRKFMPRIHIMRKYRRIVRFLRINTPILPSLYSTRISKRLRWRFLKSEGRGSQCLSGILMTTGDLRWGRWRRLQRRRRIKARCKAEVAMADRETCRLWWPRMNGIPNMASEGFCKGGGWKIIKRLDSVRQPIPARFQYSPGH